MITLTPNQTFFVAVDFSSLSEQQYEKIYDVIESFNLRHNNNDFYDVTETGTTVRYDVALDLASAEILKTEILDGLKEVCIGSCNDCVRGDLL